MGLNLSVQPGGTKSWTVRWTRNGRAHEVGLGRADHDGTTGGVTLSQARAAAVKVRTQIEEGKDPIRERMLERYDAQHAERSAKYTFEVAVTNYVYRHGYTRWRNDKHTYQWLTTLRHASTVLGDIPVADITPDDVLKVLEPIWLTKPTTASRMRARIEAVLDYAEACGHRAGKNPAAWKGNLKYRLPAHRRVKDLNRQPALPWRRMPDFFRQLRDREATSSRLALEFLVLTVVRTRNVLEARWSEIDEAQSVWLLRPERMKALREHRVPLCAEAVAVLAAARNLHPPKDREAFIFPGARRGRPLSNMALLMILRGMNDTARLQGLGTEDRPFWRDERSGRGVVPHGFRSTFFDFGEDASNVRTDVLSACLAHQDGDRVRGAYRRTDFWNARVAAHRAWEHFLLTGAIHDVAMVEVGAPIPQIVPQVPVATTGDREAR